MRNADMPAMPQTDEYRGNLEYYLMHDESIGEPPTEGAGLTKREHFAAVAMQGLIASWGQHDVTDFGEIASDAVLAADALLAELERTS